MAESKASAAAESRKLAAILFADIVGYSRLVEADEEGTLARLRTLRSSLIDPTIATHNGRLVKRLGDGALVEFRSVVEAVRCAIDVLHGLAERNARWPDGQRIEARVGIHLGDVVEEADGDLMGDGVNIAARLQGFCEPGGICLSEDAYRQVRDKINERFVDLGEQILKNIAYPIRAYAWTEPAGQGAARRPALMVAKAPAEPARTATASQRPRRGRPVLALVGAAIFALLAAWLWLDRMRVAPSPSPAPTGAVEALEQLERMRSLPSPTETRNDKLAGVPRVSIVVLTFANLSGDPEQDHFADGLADALTSRLSRLPDSVIVAYGRPPTPAAGEFDEKRLGRELGVRYALDGSVRRFGHTFEIDAQLISTEDGFVLWSDRFLSERDGRGDLKADVASRIGDAVWRALAPR